MKLGLGLYRDLLTSETLRFARQAGVTHVVAHLPGQFSRGDDILTSDQAAWGFGVSQPDDPLWRYEGLRNLKARINAEGLELEALENFAPADWYDVLLDGPRRAEQIAYLQRVVRDVGRAGIPTIGYNFSLAGVWGRIEGPYARGGARSVGFQDPIQTLIPVGMVWNMVYDPARFDPERARGTIGPVGPNEMWRRLAGFLDQLIPVAEEAGVTLALHPDDPPLPVLRGTARLVHHPDLFQRVLELRPSRRNAIEFCVGTVSEMQDADVYAAIDRYSKARQIAYVHLRNVRGKAPNYHETFVDEGDTDMLRVLAILHRNGYDGVVIPDHTPLLDCRAPWHAGVAYTLGWMRAAITAVKLR
ncbi:MAG TPA: mannonate dehydratase [Candidatus Sulfotelmatobacter sp.]|nr:mannonate dehydratase [Candidatus Sulfotelmatobacter sp.]